jgi:hypothetical protein
VTLDVKGMIKDLLKHKPQNPTLQCSLLLARTWVVTNTTNVALAIYSNQHASSYVNFELMCQTIRVGEINHARDLIRLVVPKGGSRGAPS